MSAGTQETPNSSSELTSLPAELEGELFAVWMDESRDRAHAGLEQLCARHPGQEAELRRVAARLDAAGAAFPAQQRPETTPAPNAIGPYQVLRELGRGGFAIVWLAEQHEPLRRQVAIKVLHDVSRAGGQRVLRRFESERQTLAHLQHTGIAKVYDAGKTEHGESFIVMEYVPGVPITRYCDEHCSSIEARLELFLQVCAAVQHAHRSGVLHRDLKPGNILVYDEGGPRAKVIDFGLAKALETSSADELGVTEEGRFVGTPEYMSPEQASAVPVDTRTDVYSLGVLLYELLTGELPHDPTALRGVPWHSALRILREEDPPRPSEALRKSETRLRAAAERRGSRMQPLLRRLRGDLTWIVMCALEKDRERRYSSVTELANDVRRHLDQLPISAGTPALGYRMRKFSRRHKALVASSAAIALILVLSAILGAHAVAEIVHARNSALERQHEADANHYAAQIALAKAAFDAHRAEPMREALRRAPAARRNWEWRYLASISDASRGPLATTDELLYHPTLAPSEELLLYCRRSGLGSIAALDLRTGTTRYRLWRPWNEIFDIAASPRGEHFAIGYSLPAQVHVHDSRDGTPLRWLRGGKSGAAVIELRNSHASSCFHPGESLLAVASGGEIRFFDTKDGEEIAQDQPCRLDPHRVQELVFDPTGQILLGACNPGALVVLRRRGKEPQYRQVELFANSNSLHWPKVAIAPDRRRAAVCSPNEQLVHVFDLERLERAFSLQTDSNVFDLCFAPESGLLVTAHVEGSLRYWDLRTRHQVGAASGHTGTITGIVGQTGSKSLFTTSTDGTLRSWSSQPPTTGAEIISPGGDMRSVALHPHEPLRFESKRDGVAAVDTRDQRRLWLDPELRAAASMLVDTERQRLLAGSYTGQLYAWDIRQGPMSRTRKTLMNSWIYEMRLAPDGRHIALLGNEFCVILDAASLEPRHRCTVEDRASLSHTCFVPGANGNDRLLLGQRSLRLFDAQSGELLERRAWEAQITGLALSPDGSFLCVCDRSGSIRMLDSESLSLRGELDTGTDTAPFAHPCFSPDGTRLAVGDNRALSVRIFDVGRSVALLVLYDHQAWTRQLLFDPAGEGLYVLAGPGAGSDRLLRWRAPHDVRLPDR